MFWDACQHTCAAVDQAEIIHPGCNTLMQEGKQKLCRAGVCRDSEAPFTFVVSIIIPGPPHRLLVMAWASNKAPPGFGSTAKLGHSASSSRAESNSAHSQPSASAGPSHSPPTVGRFSLDASRQRPSAQSPPEQSHTPGMGAPSRSSSPQPSPGSSGPSQQQGIGSRVLSLDANMSRSGLDTSSQATENGSSSSGANCDAAQAGSRPSEFERCLNA